MAGSQVHSSTLGLILVLPVSYGPVFDGHGSTSVFGSSFRQGCVPADGCAVDRASAWAGPGPFPSAHPHGGGGWRCQSAVHLSDRIDFGSGMSRRLLLPSRPTPFRSQVMTFVHQEGGLRRITNRTLGNAKTRSGSTGGLRKRPSSLGWLVGRESETLVGDGQRCIRCGSDED